MNADRYTSTAQATGGFKKLAAEEVPITPLLGEIRRVPTSELLPGDTPRLSGQDELHSQILAEVVASLPPIVVHSETMRVIDGAHRVRAAEIAGQTQVDVRFFKGTADEAFVEAVRTNVAHGKPLSSTEREAAAHRLLSSYPSWSDRAIADICAVSTRTVAALRRRATENGLQLNARVGRDGRVRPVDASEGRRRAMDFLSRNPNASLREIARQANISPATARDVKARLRRGIDPIARRRRSMLPPLIAQEGPALELTAEPSDQLQVLREDSSLNSVPSGARCVQLFSDRFVTAGDWTDIAGDLPLSRIYVVADLARSCAKSWLAFAEALHARSRRA